MRVINKRGNNTKGLTSKRSSKLSESKRFKEYFVKEGDTVDDALAALNIVNDMEYSEEWSENIDDSDYEDFDVEAFLGVIKSFEPKVQELEKELEPYKNKELSKAMINLVEDHVYDGSDIYNEYLADALEDLYETQISVLEDLLAMCEGNYSGEYDDYDYEDEDDYEDYEESRKITRRKIRESKISTTVRLDENTIDLLLEALDRVRDTRSWQTNRSEKETNNAYKLLKSYR